MQPIVEVKDVYLSVRTKKILKGCSLNINKGEVLSILGINGSGKSSLLSVILGDQKVNSGEINYFPSKKELFKKVSTVYDNQIIFPQLKVKELFRFFACGYNVMLKDYETLISVLDLDRLQNSLIRDLSQGERVKVNIFTALLPNPKLLIMDESFSAIDPTVKDKLWMSIRQNSDAIVYTTHDWVLAESFSDKIMFVMDGKILSEPLSKEDLYGILPSRKKIMVQDNSESFLELFDYYNCEEKMGYVLYTADKLERIKSKTSNFSILDTNLKDVYLYLSNKQENV